MDSMAMAADIVRKLSDAGHAAYFAGGWVRDYLMGHPSEDIDIATDAPPNQIMDLFPRTILVGLSFGVVIVLVNGHQFEVATFRKDLHYADGRRPEKILFSKAAEEDAKRRDFTINGMFYDPVTEVVHDFVHGYQDLKRRIIRTIGDPHLRFQEDRLRMIRAIRFAARFGFTIDPETQEAIKENAHSLFPAVAMERVWQEFNKMHARPHFDWALAEMQRLGLLQVIFPELKEVHLKELRRRASIICRFPNNAPTALCLMELFPGLPSEEKMAICRRLKVPKQEIAIIEFCDYLRCKVASKELEDVEWATLYAHRYSRLCFDALAAGYPEEEAEAFLDNRLKREQRLKKHIERIRTKKPLVSAELLKKEGIAPGVQMGILLKEAEKMAINQNVECPIEILQKLKNLPLWPRVAK